MDTIAARLHAIRAGLPPEAQLIAVSKGQGAEAIREALVAGQQLFGENRVQEAQGKWPALKAGFPDAQLHLIGPLQTNKVKEALALFDVIHTLDRVKLVDALAHEISKGAKNIPCFIQVNTGHEPQKAGVTPEEADAFITYAQAKLSIIGLMCIPPAEEDPAPHFTLLRDIAARHGLPQLSMGMSGDYATALACGATHIRVGTAIFGERHYA